MQTAGGCDVCERQEAPRRRTAANGGLYIVGWWRRTSNELPQHYFNNHPRMEVASHSPIEITPKRCHLNPRKAPIPVLGASVAYLTSIWERTRLFCPPEINLATRD